MSAHTPGPWAVKEHSEHWIDVYDSAARPLLGVEGHTREERQATARLIAAAPALLELLKLAQVRLFMLDGANAEYEAIDALLTSLGVTNRG